MCTLCLCSGRTALTQRLFADAWRRPSAPRRSTLPRATLTCPRQRSASLGHRTASSRPRSRANQNNNSDFTHLSLAQCDAMLLLHHCIGPTIHCPVPSSMSHQGMSRCEMQHTPA
jgi:hypothetical protein